MGLLQKLLSTVGLRESDSDRERTSGAATVTVEHEPKTASESAVKGTEGVSAETPASGSTGTITDTGDEEIGAAEPSEAAGDAAGDMDEEPDLDGSDDGDGDVETEVEIVDDSTASGSDVSPDVLDGIGPAYAQRLANADVDTVAELADADGAELADQTGLGQGRIANWIEQAKEY